MVLASNARLSPYEIQLRLGAGGMDRACGGCDTVVVNWTAAKLQSNCWQLLESLRCWIDRDACSFQRGHSQKRLNVFWSEDHAAGGDLTHELNLRQAELVLPATAIG